jgi:hydrogenase expression/formation protein HypE
VRPEGKLAAELMRKAVYPNLGRRSRRVKTGPAVGLDNAVVSAGRGRVMILTVDPMSAIPAFGMELSARLSVGLIASDYTTSGVMPQYAAFSYNFPRAMTETQVVEYLEAVGSECGRLGVSIVGGHTGGYPGGAFTVIGAGWMSGFHAEGEYVTPAMARAGDLVYMTKSAALEATASLALSFPGFAVERLGRRGASSAKKMAELCSTVEDARAAAGAGLGRTGVTSMHDATEGGVLGGLSELAEASGSAVTADLEEIPVTREARVLCEAFGIDPLATMGEGALLVTCRPGASPRLEGRMRRSGIGARRIGRLAEGRGLWVSEGGAGPRRYSPRPDGYWASYARAIRSGMK